MKKNKKKKIVRAVKAVKPKAVKKFKKKDLIVFKGLLLKKKEELLEGIDHVSVDTFKKSQKDAAGDISAYAFHMADVATDTYDREFSMGMGSSEREVLYEVNEALKRIEDDSYGVCESCLGLISKIRLKAVPHTKLCLKCQEVKEK